LALLACCHAQSIECQVCEFAIGWVEGQLEDNATEEDVRNLLDSVCDLIGPFKDSCVQMINDNLDQIVQLIINEENPQTVCSQIGMCSSLKKLNHKLQALKAMKKLRAPADIKCDVCDFVITWVENDVKDNRSEQSIVDALDTVCAFLGPEKQVCLDMVAQETPVIVSMLLDQEDPHKVCTQISFCTSLAKLARPHHNSNKSKADCAGCQFIVNHIVREIGNDDSATRKEEVVNSVCSSLPSFIRTQCTRFIIRHASVIMDNLGNSIDAKILCSDLAICHINEAKQTEEEMHTAIKRSMDSFKIQEVRDSTQQAAMPSTVECQFCEWMIGAVEEWLTENATTTALSLYLQNLCTFLPATFVPTCTNFVLVYTDQVIEWVLTKEAPPTVCTQLQVCNFPSGVVNKKSIGTA